MELLRLWYRSNLVEPVLLTMLGVMIVTGVHMVFQYTKETGNTFCALQTVAGAYMALFICSHLLAVLSARSAGVETDWYYAVSKTGRVQDSFGYLYLIPYYILGVFFLLVHASLGLRIVLLKHDIGEHRANYVFYSLAAGAALITLLISAAMFGVHVGVD